MSWSSSIRHGKFVGGACLRCATGGASGIFHAVDYHDNMPVLLLYSVKSTAAVAGRIRDR